MTDRTHTATPNEHPDSAPNAEPVSETRFAITGMHCAACAQRIEKVLGKKGVSAQVNFANETALVRHDQRIRTDDIRAWIVKAGFEASVLTSAQTSWSAPERMPLPWSLILLVILSLPFLVGMIGMLMGTHVLMPAVWVQFVLASIVQFGLAWPFYRGAWASIRDRLAGMDVLIVLGTLVIWVYSSYVWLTSTAMEHAHHDAPMVYFEASVMVISFVSLGKYLEARTKKYSLDSISLMAALTPSIVMIKRADGYESVATKEILTGDILLIKTGDRAPSDGVVLSGQGYCDESHLTGESKAVHKMIGSPVLAGALLTDGTIEYQVTALGEHTKLGEMITALAHAQGSKAQIARLADRMAGVFVPVVAVIAVLTLGINLLVGLNLEMALMRAAAVLVIACPCALGLATPAAIMAGMGVAARHGVWFKDASSLEIAGSIDIVCLDKTGTLTTGKPSIIAHAFADGDDSQADYEALLALMAAIEVYTNHPLAASISQSAKRAGLSLPDVEHPTTHIGAGVSAKHAGRLVKVGKPSFTDWSDAELADATWIADTQAPSNASLARHLSDVIAASSLVAMSIDQNPVLLLALSDSLKADAKAVIDAMHADGIQTTILSGDQPSAVTAVANALGIHHAYAQLSAGDKVTHIRALQLGQAPNAQVPSTQSITLNPSVQNQGVPSSKAVKKVAMIGDGINDAAAMAAADASFAVWGATDIAVHSASARLTQDSLKGAHHAIVIAKRTLANIRQNLFFAFIYNIIGIPLAAMGLLNPMIAALMMTASSLTVLGNALRLTKLRLTPGA